MSPEQGLVLPARLLPRLEFEFDQALAAEDWHEMDQTAGPGLNGWE